MQKGFDNLFKFIIATAIVVGILAVVAKLFGYALFVVIVAALMIVIVLLVRRNRGLNEDLRRARENR